MLIVVLCDEYRHSPSCSWIESLFRFRISLNALHSPLSWSLYSQSSENWYLKRSNVFSPLAHSSIIGPHVFVLRLRSWTNVMNVTAAAVEELEGANNCTRVRTLRMALRSTETHLHVVDTLVEDKFSRTRRVATEGNRQFPRRLTPPRQSRGGCL